MNDALGDGNTKTPDQDSRQPALQVKALHAHLAGSHILQGLDFEVPAGGVTVMLGRNGVGKTTTVRTILGLVNGSGEVRIFGQDVSGWPTHRIARLGVGYVPEDRDIFAALTVGENLRLAETGPRPAYDHVFDLFPELQERSRQMAGTLSGGQQQMLAIGRVLLNDSPLLLVDEPTKGLSPLFVGQVMDALERVGTERTVLLIDQNVHAVRHLARWVIILDQGRVAHVGSVDTLDDAALVHRLLGVSGAS
ncbi:MAG: ABC transporter ATP-binding protein [Solirubrobacteraceae bacterium]